MFPPFNLRAWVPIAALAMAPQALVTEPPPQLQPARGAEIGARYQAWLSPHQEGGDRHTWCSRVRVHPDSFQEQGWLTKRICWRVTAMLRARRRSTYEPVCPLVGYSGRPPVDSGGSLRCTAASDRSPVLHALHSRPTRLAMRAPLLVSLRPN